MEDKKEEIKRFYTQFFPKPWSKFPSNFFTLATTEDLTRDKALEYLRKQDPALLFPHVLDYLQRRDNLDKLAATFILASENDDLGRQLDINSKGLVLSVTHKQPAWVQTQFFWRLPSAFCVRILQSSLR